MITRDGRDIGGKESASIAAVAGEKKIGLDWNLSGRDRALHPSRRRYARPMSDGSFESVSVQIGVAFDWTVLSGATQSTKCNISVRCQSGNGKAVLQRRKRLPPRVVQSHQPITHRRLRRAERCPPAAIISAEHFGLHYARSHKSRLGSLSLSFSLRPHLGDESAH